MTMDPPVEASMPHAPAAAAPALEPAGRLLSIDVARGVGIVLVVAGHVLGAMVTTGLVRRDGEAQALVDFLYAFHMPLFFVLSGLLTPRASTDSLAATVASKARSLLWPYLLWSAVLVALHAGAAPLANHPVGAHAILEIAWQPVQHLWFLYVLLLLSLAWAAGTALGLPSAALLVAATAAHFLPGRADLGSWGAAYLVATHAAWFAAGATFGAAAVTRWATRVSAPVAVAAVLLLAVAVASTNGWTTAAPGTSGSDVAAAFAALAGTAAVILLATQAARFPQAGPVVKLLVALGRSSLAIYLLHPLVASALRSLLQRGAGVGDPSVHFALETALGLVIPMVAERAALACGAGWLFRWPSPARPSSLGARSATLSPFARGASALRSTAHPPFPRHAASTDSPGA